MTLFEAPWEALKSCFVLFSLLCFVLFVPGVYERGAGHNNYIYCLKKKSSLLLQCEHIGGRQELFRKACTQVLEEMEKRSLFKRYF